MLGDLLSLVSCVAVVYDVNCPDTINSCSESVTALPLPSFLSLIRTVAGWGSPLGRGSRMKSIYVAWEIDVSFVSSSVFYTVM